MRTFLGFAFVASAPIASAVVCDDTSSKKVACFDLKSGNKMPQIAMGSWSGSYKDCASTDYTCVQQSARFIAETWLHLGGTHLDTANDYRTQTALADALRNTPNFKREELYLTTKCPGAIGYEAIVQCADDNLQMLGQFADGVGYIDLLLVHFPAVIKAICRFNRTSPECAQSMERPATKAELQDTWRAMEELKRIGVVKSIGISDYNITQIEQTLETATQPIEVNQVEWNPLNHDEALLQFSKKHGIQLQAWSPLGGSKGSVLSHPAVKSIASTHNVSTAQVTLRWALQRDVAVVVGTANADHAASDLDIFGFELTSDEVASISALQTDKTASLLV